MNILVLHRYPPEQVIGTNASFPDMLLALKDRAKLIIFLSYQSKKRDKIKDVLFKEIRYPFRRGNALDKVLKSVLWLVAAPLRARHIVKGYDIDIVYCDDSLPYYPYFIKLLIGKKSKVIMRLGDLQTGYLFADHGYFRNLLFQFFHILEVLIWRRIDGIIAISGPMKEYATKEGADPEKITVVKESIDLSHFSPIKTSIRHNYGIKETDTLIMFHGAIEKAKGVEVLIDAAELLSDNKTLFFMVVGSGTEFSRIRALVKGKKLDRFILTGWVDFSKIAHYINSADIGIVLRRDNMANHFVVTTALMQYWACQRPVLAPDLDSIKEVAIDGEHAVIYRAGDAEDLSKKILLMLENRDHWPEMGSKGRLAVGKYFEKGKIGRQMAEVLYDYYLQGLTRSDELMPRDWLHNTAMEEHL